MASIYSRKVPIALILFVYGTVVAIYQYTDLRSEYKLPALQIGSDFASPVVPSASKFKTGFTYLFCRSYRSD